MVALDFDRGEPAVALAGKLAGKVGGVKVGLELYLSEGQQIVRELGAAGHRIFLDLKLHDIPNTVAGAARVAGSLGVWLLTVHASGGEAMVRAAVEAAAEGAAAVGEEPPRIMAVTVLTSLSDDDLGALGVEGGATETALRWARLARGAGAAGVICSPREAAAMREALGADALIVTPGVRPPGSAVGDQARVATPAEAVAAGADHLVVGRPIRAAEDPVAAAEAIAASL
ncbi:MAG: orotidine-5'-phosphate decarboxylase [Deltaproteobacteria bacterium]|nr:orotidine-5'-phosphate decarboxylase [Deltaproteobacteria bacterium]